LLLVADSTFRGDAATPVCAAIWRAASTILDATDVARLPRLDVIELAERPRLSTPMYGMISLAPAPRDSASAALAATLATHPATAALLQARGIERVVVLPVPVDFDRLGALGAALRQAGVDPTRMQADFAVHEGFHLHVQFPAWLSQPPLYAWPSWDRQPDRQELRERCYAGSPAIQAALGDEHAALLAAFDALDAADRRAGRDSALAHSRRFVELRAIRRSITDTVTVAQGDRRIPCALAEDLLELEEGVPQWVGHATTVRAGMSTRAGKRGSYAQLQPEAFYQFGPLQLWVLEGLDPAVLRDLTEKIARSSSPNDATTIHGAFSIAIREHR
jgi:hypothetical protein